jgi:predicted outer membrane repeat protein
MMIANNTEREAKGKALALGLLLAALMAACLLLAAGPALAVTTFAVDRTDDPDPTTANACTTNPDDCSLRGAIMAANAATGADTITVPAGTYTLTRTGASEDAASTGDLDVTGELTLTGAGARTTSVAGEAASFDDRVFHNQEGATTTITGLTITGGDVGGYEGGGVNNQGDLTLDGVVVIDNAAGTGGGVDSRGGDLTLDGVSVKGNTSDFGGGIYSEKGTLNIIDSTVSGNSSTEYAGGVSHYSGPANITNSTISGNKAALSGGGVLAASASINVRNSTIANNESGGLGGGILTAGPGSTVVVKNTIVAGNTLGNCGDFGQFGGVVFSQGNNISSDDSCNFTKSTDKQNTNPRLGPLQDNDGPTDTRALLAGSPAIDSGSNTDCPDADQRGVARPQGKTCDIGAFERPNSPPLARDNSYRTKADKTLRVSARGVLANDTDPDGDTVRARVISRPGKGTLRLNSNGSFSYKAPRNFKGSVRFVYRASDGLGASDSATVRIKVVGR